MSISKQFVLAGDATFTIELPDGGHYTYRVREMEPLEGYATGITLVSLLTGPDNTSSFTYLGKLLPDMGEVVATAKSRVKADTLSFRLLNRILARIWADDHAGYEQHGYRAHHEGKCGRCGRKLTVPGSIASGIGPECARQMQVA